MKILLTGGTGFIGQALIKLLSPSHEIVVLTRNANNARRVIPSVACIETLDNLENLDDFQAVINLAGEPIVGKRWSDAQKHRLCHSRWDLTARLAGLIKASQTPPQVFISASAIGFYGIHDTSSLTENAKPNPDFAHDLCAKWENLALQADGEQTRVCIARIGIVLGANGGALAKMLPAFKLGLGGPIGHGEQGMSWVHLDDLLGMIRFMLETESARGIYNATAPVPVSNKTFTQTLGKVLHRPAFLPAPAFALKCILGESAMLLTEGQYVVPSKATIEGFEFEFSQLEPALKDILA